MFVTDDALLMDKWKRKDTSNMMLSLLDRLSAKKEDCTVVSKSLNNTPYCQF